MGISGRGESTDNPRPMGAKEGWKKRSLKELHARLPMKWLV